MRPKFGHHHPHHHRHHRHRHHRHHHQVVVVPRFRSRRFGYFLYPFLDWHSMWTWAAYLLLTLVLYAA